MDKPTGRIRFTVKVDGKEIDCAESIRSVHVDSSFNRIPSATVTIVDGGTTSNRFVTGDSDVFIPGKSISLAAGYGDRQELIFKGIITRQGIKLSQGISHLVLSAKHEAVKLTLARKTASFQDMTDSDVIKAILSDHGIKATVDRSEVQHESLIQYNATDWDFINMRSEACGQILAVTPEGISSKVPDLVQEPAVRIDNNFDILDFNAELDGLSAFDNYVSKGWNYKSSEVEEVSVRSGAHDVSQGNMNSSALARSMGNGDFPVASDGMVPSSDGLNALASSVMMRKNLSRICGQVTVKGFPSMKIGDMISLEHLGKRFAGSTIVSGLVHDISSRSWSTQITFGYEAKMFADKFSDISMKPAAGTLPAVNGLQVAIVEKITGDPLEENRILVRLQDSDETKVWARLALLDAGNERGTFFLPEVDDEVVVGFINDNPGLAVILGMLHSSTRPAPVEHDDDNFIKGIYTKEKLRIEFDDDKKSILLETPGGNRICLSDDAKGISFEDQNGNKLTMDDNGITIESAKALEIKASQDATLKGTNVTLEANASFKATGNSGAEVSTNAIAVLKGSLVQIN